MHTSASPGCAAAPRMQEPPWSVSSLLSPHLLPHLLSPAQEETSLPLAGARAAGAHAHLSLTWMCGCSPDAWAPLPPTRGGLSAACFPPRLLPCSTSDFPRLAHAVLVLMRTSAPPGCAAAPRMQEPPWSVSSLLSPPPSPPPSLPCSRGDFPSLGWRTRCWCSCAPQPHLDVRLLPRCKGLPKARLCVRLPLRARQPPPSISRVTQLHHLQQQKRGCSACLAAHVHMRPPCPLPAPAAQHSCTTVAAPPAAPQTSLAFSGLLWSGGAWQDPTAKPQRSSEPHAPRVRGHLWQPAHHWRRGYPVQPHQPFPGALTLTLTLTLTPT